MYPPNIAIAARMPATTGMTNGLMSRFWERAGVEKEMADMDDSSMPRALHRLA